MLIGRIPLSSQPRRLRFILIGSFICRRKGECFRLDVFFFSSFEGPTRTLRVEREGEELRLRRRRSARFGCCRRGVWSRCRMEVASGKLTRSRRPPWRREAKPEDPRRNGGGGYRPQAAVGAEAGRARRRPPRAARKSALAPPPGRASIPSARAALVSGR